MSTKSASAIIIRDPDDIYQAHGEIENGWFDGRWHFSFESYYNRDYTHFGTLRVFNDDTLSPGAIWPMHPHRNIEVVTYCVAGVFRHADEHGRSDILRKGWVQHTTIGKGMSHAEINDSPIVPVRFIQMWFLPMEIDLEPAVQRKEVEQADRTDVLLPLIGEEEPGALPIASEARVYSSFLTEGKHLTHHVAIGHGAYLYVLEGGPLRLNGEKMPALSAAKIIGGGTEAEIEAEADAELLLVVVPLAVSNRPHMLL